jgi:hypothetical protein
MRFEFYFCLTCDFDAWILGFWDTYFGKLILGHNIIYWDVDLCMGFLWVLNYEIIHI